MKIIKFLITIKNQYNSQIYLVLILVLALYLRIFNINWDNNYYFHPDERAIVMFTIPIQMPKSLSEFLSITSPLNPHFFAYGNFPIYLLRLLGEAGSHINPLYKVYGGIHIVGRLVSAFADIGSVFFVYLIGNFVFSKKVGLFGALFYALSVFPIQTSHFYAVDPLLTFFMTVTIYFLLKFIKKNSFSNSMGIGLFTGLSLATKISSAILFLDIVCILLFLFIKKGRNKLIPIYFLSIVFFAILIFVLTQPYAFIDAASFLSQTQLQSHMSNNPFLFPYTLQYVGKIPYLYEIKNIFLWGQGPIISSINILGIGVVTYFLFQKKIKNRIPVLFLIFSFLLYFLIFGKFAVGWMRYMLPIYPLLSVFGGYFISEIIVPKIPKKKYSNYFFRKTCLIIFFLSILIYPLSFISIYNYPNTRIQASDWINKNIPIGKTLAVEHWDDALPVYGGQKYIQLTLPLYDPDTTSKWNNINATLKQADYIIISSNRLYTPLQKLTNCSVLPKDKCYPLTAKYYQSLFSGNLGFRKIAEFTEYPTIPFINLKIIDDSADESFTVYDHPKILIFKRE